MINTTLLNHPLFIAGHPKSGTSLLRNLLDSHSQLVVFPEESKFFRYILPKLKNSPKSKYTELINSELLQIFNWNSTNPTAHQTGFEDRDYTSINFENVSANFNNFLNKYNFTHYGDLLAFSILAYGKEIKLDLTNRKLWVEKTPYNEYYAKQIFSWWPKAKIIHVIRNPLDNYASYSIKHPDWTPDSFAYNWKKGTRVGISNLKMFGNNRYLLIRFEDLISNPKSTLLTICNFLEINFEPSLKSPTRNDSPWKGNSMFLDSFDKISKTPLGRWENQLDDRQISLIEIIAKKEINFFEYPFYGNGNFSRYLSARYKNFRHWNHDQIISKIRKTKKNMP